MAAIPLTADTLHVATISKADHWVDDVLPRFVAHLKAACSGMVATHLLLLEDRSDRSDAFARSIATARRLFDSVVVEPFHDPWPHQRLLVFDALRARLPNVLGVPHLLYLDPDTDVVGDLQGVQHVAPEADILWAANPLPLQPVLDDLRRHGFLTADEGPTPACVEPGCLFLRRDLDSEFTSLRDEFPDVHRFAPGSTYWNMLVRRLGHRAARLHDSFNRTFWDVPAAAGTARTVHFTGQWKRLQPFVSYDRPSRRILVHDRPAPLPTRAEQVFGTPRALNVVMLVRDNASWLPHAFERCAAWEDAGVSMRYHILENDSLDDTARLAADFMRTRRGRLESRRLAVRSFTAAGGTNYDRIMPLARMRNFITDVAMSEPAADPEEWTLLLDSDVYFSTDVLTRIFSIVARDSDPRSIGMITPYTQQLFDPDSIPAIAAPIAEMPGHAGADHYFDTYAFQDLHHRTAYPRCFFARCRRCAPGHTMDTAPHLIPRTAGIVDVASAFGGFALVPTSLLRDDRLRWSTYSFGGDRLRVLSEHVLFCERLRTLTRRRIVVLQDVDCVYRR